MSIINSYRRNAKPLINVSDIYTKSETKFDSIIVTFSRNLIDALLEDNLIDIISLDTIKSISNKGSPPIKSKINPNILPS